MPNSQSITIEKATVFDDTRLKEIGLICYHKNIDPSHRYWLVSWLFRHYFSKRRFVARRKEGVLIYCLKNNGEIHGFYELEKNGLLSSLYVLPESQHQGYGKYLLEDAKKKAKELHLKEIRLDASEFAEGFYLTQGFKKNGQARIVFGITMIPLKIKIS